MCLWCCLYEIFSWRITNCDILSHFKIARMRCQVSKFVPVRHEKGREQGRARIGCFATCFKDWLSQYHPVLSSYSDSKGEPLCFVMCESIISYVRSVYFFIGGDVAMNLKYAKTSNDHFDFLPQQLNNLQSPRYHF